MNLRWFRRQPDPPKHVRLECVDGRVIPMELVYTGKRRRLHHWENANRVMVTQGEDWILAVDALPAHTTIDLVIGIETDE